VKAVLYVLLPTARTWRSCCRCAGFGGTITGLRRYCSWFLRFSTCFLFTALYYVGQTALVVSQYVAEGLYIPAFCWPFAYPAPLLCSGVPPSPYYNNAQPSTLPPFLARKNYLPVSALRIFYSLVWLDGLVSETPSGIAAYLLKFFQPRTWAAFCWYRVDFSLYPLLTLLTGYSAFTYCNFGCMYCIPGRPTTAGRLPTYNIPSF